MPLFFAKALQPFNILSKIQEDLAMKDVTNVIQFTYVEKNKIYHGTINRDHFIDQMEHMVDWYPDCNENATKLCELLPAIASIKINKDIIETQDVPFIEYLNIDDDTPRCIKFRRYYTIIWSFFLHQCEEAKKNS